jgi:hypothetical protein
MGSSLFILLPCLHDSVFVPAVVHYDKGILTTLTFINLPMQYFTKLLSSYFFSLRSYQIKTVYSFFLMYGTLGDDRALFLRHFKSLASYRINCARFNPNRTSATLSLTVLLGLDIASREGIAFLLCCHLPSWVLSTGRRRNSTTCTQSKLAIIDRSAMVYSLVRQNSKIFCETWGFHVARASSKSSIRHAILQSKNSRKPRRACFDLFS